MRFLSRSNRNTLTCRLSSGISRFAKPFPEKCHISVTLANNGSVLEQSTPNQWPEWDVPGGQLTTKGGVLEIYMGHYMREWLAELGMVTSGECPTPDTVHSGTSSGKNGHDGPNV